MSILAWLLVGAVAGWLADEMMKGDSFGILGNIVLGIVGALVGGFLASSLFNVGDPLSGFNLPTLIIAFVGAILVLFIARAFRRGRA
jgi:uncharacterized membrane protein YeaQ/YmgE (transglycosylase-associated protein family)